MSKIILGIIAKNAGGKTTATEYLKSKYSAVSFRFSNPLKDILNRLHLESSRENFQTLSTVLRQNFSEDILSRVIAEDVKTADAKIVITEGVRRPTDVKYLKDLPGYHLIYIETEAKTRYDRLKRRVEKPGDQTKTWKEFLAEEKQESEKKIDEIAAAAEFKIDNNGSLQNLYQQLDELIHRYADETDTPIR